MQSCLEKKGIESRQEHLVRSDYNKEDSYSATHKDAISDGDVFGKGTQSGGHGHWLPDCTKSKTEIDYSNFDTTQGGGLYDIEGRNGIGGRERLINYCLYNQENEYSAKLIDTTENQHDGQYVVS